MKTSYSEAIIGSARSSSASVQQRLMSKLRSQEQMFESQLLSSCRLQPRSTQLPKKLSLGPRDQPLLHIQLKQSVPLMPKSSTKKPRPHSKLNTITQQLRVKASLYQ
jgi:hypothetical protein